MKLVGVRERTLLAVTTGAAAGIIWGVGSVIVQGATPLGGFIVGLVVGVIWTMVWYIVPKLILARRDTRQKRRDS